MVNLSQEQKNYQLDSDLYCHISSFQFLFNLYKIMICQQSQQQMENIHRTQQSQKVILHTDQKIYPRLSTQDDQEAEQEIEQKQEIDIVYDKNCQQSHSEIVNKPSLDQNICYCRICLQGELPQTKLLSPCNCSNFVHDKCLLEWLVHKQLIDNRAAMKCQVCLTCYSINIIQKYCFTFQICKRQNEKFIPSFVIQLLIILTLLGSTVLSIIFLFNINTSNDFLEQTRQLVDLPKNTLIVLGFIALLFTSALTVGLSFRIVYNFCYGVQMTLIQQNRQ